VIEMAEELIASSVRLLSPFRRVRVARLVAIIEIIFAKSFDVTFSIHYTSQPLMQTCMNISTTSWPTMSVAQATRHTRLSQGCMFSLGQSKEYPGATLETNLDKPEVSR
jgi:hypothetical protein